MDVLAPGNGEIIGGSQREERLDVLDRNMAERGIDREHYAWYRDLPRYGTVPHAGFGLAPAFAGGPSPTSATPFPSRERRAMRGIDAHDRPDPHFCPASLTPGIRAFRSHAVPPAAACILASLGRLQGALT